MIQGLIIFINHEKKFFYTGGKQIMHFEITTSNQNSEFLA